MGNDVHGCCTLDRRFNVYHVQRVAQHTFSLHFWDQVTASAYGTLKSRPEFPRQLLLSVVCPHLIPQPVYEDGEWELASVHRLSERPCGVLVALHRDRQSDMALFFLEEAAFRGDDPPSGDDILEWPMYVRPTTVPDTFTQLQAKKWFGEASVEQWMQRVRIDTSKQLATSPFPQTIRGIKRRWSQVAGHDGGHAEELCIVCGSEPAVVRFRLCPHRVACRNCAPHLSTCPLCRAPIRVWDRLMRDDTVDWMLLLSEGWPVTAALMAEPEAWSQAIRR